MACIAARNTLTSAIAGHLVIPRTRIKFAERGFEVAGPRTWNRLPQNIRHCIATFKRLLNLMCLTYRIDLITFKDNLLLHQSCPRIVGRNPCNFFRLLWRHLNHQIINKCYIYIYIYIYIERERACVYNKYSIWCS